MTTADAPITVGPVRTRPVTTDQHLIYLARRLDTIEHKIDRLVETYKQADAERRVYAALDRSTPCTAPGGPRTTSDTPPPSSTTSTTRQSSSPTPT